MLLSVSTLMTRGQMMLPRGASVGCPVSNTLAATIPLNQQRPSLTTKPMIRINTFSTDSGTSNYIHRKFFQINSEHIVDEIKRRKEEANKRWEEFREEKMRKEEEANKKIVEWCEMHAREIVYSVEFDNKIKKEMTEPDNWKYDDGRIIFIMFIADTNLKGKLDNHLSKLNSTLTHGVMIDKLKDFIKKIILELKIINNTCANVDILGFKYPDSTEYKITFTIDPKLYEKDFEQ